jgi:hypothetical protein
MNFSFQNGLLLSSLNITLEVKTSSYDLKSLMVGHLRLLNWSWILEVMLLGVPIKCFIIVKAREFPFQFFHRRWGYLLRLFEQNV